MTLFSRALIQSSNVSQQTKPPPLRYASPVGQDAAPFATAFALLLGTAALLSFPSFLVIFSGANDEPYFGTIRKLVLRRVPWALLVMLILPLLAALWLAESVDGYISDLIRAQAMNSAAPAASAP